MSDTAHLNGVREPQARDVDVQGTAPELAEESDHHRDQELRQPEEEEDYYEEGYSAPAALLRLLVGGALIGVDESMARLRAWDAATRTPAAPSRPHETPQRARSPLGYAPVGLLFESGARLWRGYRTLRAELRRRADDLDQYADETYLEDDLDYYASRPPFDVMWRRFYNALSAAEATVDRWAARGQMEAESGRRIARHAATSAVDELLDYMAHNPQVRHLIEQQATDVVSSTMDEVHDRTVEADMWVERVAHNLLRRPAGALPTSPAAPASGVTAPLPPNEAEAPNRKPRSQNKSEPMR